MGSFLRLVGAPCIARACGEVQAEQVNGVYWEARKKPEIRRSERARSAGSSTSERNALSGWATGASGVDLAGWAGKGQQPFQGWGDECGMTRTAFPLQNSDPLPSIGASLGALIFSPSMGTSDV